MEEQYPEGESGRQAAGGLDRVNPLAAGVLRRNGIKSWTKPAPTLYPHQWSWDSAFIALGLAHVDNRRARDELESLFANQWATGKVPHIVFNPEAPQRATSLMPSAGTPQRSQPTRPLARTRAVCASLRSTPSPCAEYGRPQGARKRSA